MDNRSLAITDRIMENHSPFQGVCAGAKTSYQKSTIIFS
jgi:hypothetical protein